MTQLLNDELANTVLDSVKKLAFYRKRNAEKHTYVEGRNCLSHLSIFLDDNIGSLGLGLPWAKMAISALHDNMEIEAIYVDDEDEDTIIQEIVDDNVLFAKIRESLWESMEYGASYMLSNFGNVAGFEPDVKITSESPNTAFGEYDAGNRLLKSMLKVKIETGKNGKEVITHGEIYLPDIILYFKVDSNDKFEIIDARKGLGYIPGVKFINSDSGSLGEGQSEVNHAIRSLVDYALAQFGNMRVASDAFAQPGQYIVGFGTQPADSAGKPSAPPLSRKAGAIQGIPFVVSKDGKEVHKPEVGQLQAGSPDTYIKIVESLVKELAHATRIPHSQLGIGATNIPASAEAIKNNEKPFVRRIEKKEKIFSEPIERIVRIAYQMKTGKKLSSRIRVKWAEVGTNTLASNTDAMTKAVAAGMLPPTSDFVYDKLGVPYSERKKIREELNRGQNSLLFKTIMEKSEALSGNAVLDVPTGEELEQAGDVVE